MIKLFSRIFFALVLTALVALVAFRWMAANRETVSAEALLMPDSRMVETVHGTIHALEAGPEDGPPVLLIHGSVGWSGLWQSTMDHLAANGYRAIALDLPPMGLSSRDSRIDYSRQAQALRILAVVDALDMQPIILAHSFGAGAAAEAVLVSPQSFAGAVIVAGALALGDDGFGQDLPLVLRPKLIREAAVSATVTNPFLTKLLFRQFVFQKDAITDELADVLSYPYLRQGTTPTLAAWLPSLLAPPVGAVSTDPARYGGLNLPVALIWGREDTVTPPEQAEQVRRALGEAPLFWLNNVGHIPQIEAPEAFHQTLDAALLSLKEG